MDPLQPVAAVSPRRKSNAAGPSYARPPRECGDGLLSFPSQQNRRYTPADFARVRQLVAEGLSQSQISTLTGFPEGSIHYLTHGMA